MSEKRVNIKITANTSNFNKAIKKTQKEIEKLVDTMKDFGEDKFSKDLEKQFDTVMDTAKKFEKKIESIQELLNDFDKVKMNKLEKEIDNTADSADDLTKSIEDAQEELDDLSKTKLDKLVKELEDMIDASDDLEDQLKDVIDSTQKLDKEDFDNISDGLNDVLDAVEDVKREITELTDKLDKLDKNDLSNLDEAFDDVEKSISRATEEVQDFNTKIEDIDADKFEKLKRQIEEITKEVRELNDEQEKYNETAKNFKFDEDFDFIQEANKKLGALSDKFSDFGKTNIEIGGNAGSTFSTITEGLLSGAVAGKTMEKSFDNVADTMKDVAESFDKATDKIKDLAEEAKVVDEVFDDIDDGQGWQQYNEPGEFEFTDLIKQKEDLIREQKEYNEALEIARKTQEQINDSIKKTQDILGEEEQKLEGINQLLQDNESDQTAIVNRLKEELEHNKKVIAYLEKKKELAQNYKDNSEETNKQLEEELSKLKKECEEFGKFKPFIPMDDAEQRIKDIEKLAEEQEGLEKASDETGESIKDLVNQLNDFANIASEVGTRIENIEAELEAYDNLVRIADDESQKLNKTMNEQVKTYDNIRNEVIKYINTHKKAVMNNKDLAESFMKLHDSVKDISDAFRPLPDGMFERVIKEAKELQESFDLISTDELMGRLKHISKSIDQATESQKKYNLTMREGYSANEAAKNIMDSMKEMTSFANQMNISVRKTADGFEYFADRADKANAALDTERLDEYIDALNEYVHLIRESGGTISKLFTNDDTGKFDPTKYLEYFEKFGKPTEQIKMYLERQRAQILENIKAQKDYAATLEETTEKALKNAKAELEKAEAMEDSDEKMKAIVEAQEKVAQAEKEYAESSEKSKRIDKERIEDAKKLIKSFNEQAEALRKLGVSIKDIEKVDLSFDKSLGTLVDDIFPDDLPKRLADFKEDFQAVFKDLGNLDFGGALDGLKEIGAGLLDKLPTKFKLAAVAVGALTVALKECAEAGVNQFNKGLDTLQAGLGKIAEFARDVGQEIADAFSNITGMELDFSSLIEMPIDFESQMAKVGAIAGVTGDAFEELEEEARRLGSTTRYSATEVAEAMEYMGMAGWDNTQILAGLESVLSLATVAQMDLGQASDFVTDGLTALGYEAKDAAKFVDILAKASTSSNTSVDQMQRAFTNCAPVAGTLGVSMEDLSIALGLIADKGVKGAKAGTALKNLMANLSAPTEKQLAYIRKFNLEGAQQAIVTGDLVGGIKQFKAALAGLTPQQQNAVITTIAGKEALSGISALLNTTEEDLLSLEDAIKNCDGAATEMAANFDDTVKGALLGLSSAMQETVLQVFDKCKDDIKTVTKQLTEFFNILNGFSTGGNGSGLSDALSYLEGISEGWGEAIAQNIEKAIGAIDSFVNGGNLDKVLQIGTNIINGICDGIQAAADNGTLQSAITGAIKKIATWFSENLDTVIEVGKEIIDAISQGISENSDEISEVIRTVMEMQTEIDKVVAHEKWKLIGANLIDFICEGIVSKTSVFVSAFTGFLEGAASDVAGIFDDFFINKLSPMLIDPIAILGETIGEFLREVIIGAIERAFNVDISGPIDSFMEKLNPVNWFDNNKKKDSTGNNTKGAGTKVVDKINDELSTGKVKTDTTAASIGQGISDNITRKLETMDATQLQALNTEMQNLQTTVSSLANGMSTSFQVIQDASRTSFTGFTNIVRNQMVNSTNIVRNQCINMANIFRNQFVSMANVARNQMINVSNIVRNQAINWANIIRNQITNARNTFTSQMLSMAAVARTQMVNISNIIRNQAVSWANIISNQARNARNSLTSSFMSMAAVVRTQMANCLSSVKSYMSQIASATSKSMSMNFKVNRTITTTNTTTSASGSGGSSGRALYAANMASMASLAGSNNTSVLSSRAGSAVSSGIGINGSFNGGNNNLRLEIPILLDGKEVARGTAKYIDGQLKTMTNRENRKRGVK